MVDYRIQIISNISPKETDSEKTEPFVIVATNFNVVKVPELLRKVHFLKTKFQIFPIFLAFLRISFLENLLFTTKGTLTTIIKKNNHFLCKSKSIKFYQNL